MSAELDPDHSDKDQAMHERMAKAIVDVMRKNGECLPQDLLPFGFTKDETIDYWHKAYAIAAVEWSRLKKTA
jgi:hypothetical protein